MTRMQKARALVKERTDNLIFLFKLLGAALVVPLICRILLEVHNWRKP